MNKYMKKIFFALSMLTLLYTSCDPSTDSGSTGFSENVTAESVDAKATPVQVNGKNSNRIIIENHSPITSQWSADQLAEGTVTSSKAYDTIYVTKVGANTVTMHCKNVAVDFTKDFTVNVDEITYLSAELQKRLCVTGSEGNYTSTVGEFAGQPVQFGTAFDAGKVKVIQEVKEGKKGNVFTVENGNGVLSNWAITKEGTNEAAGTATLNGDQLMVVEEGKFNITLTYTKADGTQETYNAGSFDVESLTTKPELLEYLAGGEDGDGTTTWEWNDKASGVWGNGSFGSGNGPQWWTVSYTDIEGQGSSKAGGVKRSGTHAYFTIDTNSKTATNGDGTTLPIKVNVLEHKDASWDKGTISFPTVTNDKFVIPMGVNVNEGDAAFQKYYVLVASNDELVLAACQSDGSTGWYYVFKKKAK
jgi:hypothetical protein